jgi:methylaspartate mutase epsilon subunit
VSTEDPVTNTRLEESEFLARRGDALSQWPTGREVDLDEALAYLRALPANKNASLAMRSAQDEGRTLIQPRGGVATVAGQIDLLVHLQEAGADLLPSTLDSYTRTIHFEEAEKALRESESVGHSMLNGFPAVNHGVAGCRRVVEAVDRPLVGRPGTPDARLAAEIMFAGGYTDFEGGPLDYLFAYTQNTPPADIIRWWQHIYRLVGWYEERGILIHQEQYGSITGTLVPPGLAIAVTTIESLLAAEQGGHHIGLGYGQEGHLIQDVAALRVGPLIAKSYLERLGYVDVRVDTVFDQWMGAFPSDEGSAMGVIGWGAVAAAFGNATEVITKSPHEADGVPTKEANAAGVAATKQILGMLRNQPFPSSDRLEEEMYIIELETSSILDRVLELGEGDVAKGTVRGIEAGVLEIPFSPSRFCAGKIMPMRDAEGAVRLWDFGNLPYSKEVKDYHAKWIGRRERSERRDAGYAMLVDDVTAISLGTLV